MRAIRARHATRVTSLLALLLVGPASLPAQEQPAPAGPFGDINQHLERLADRQLELVRAMQPMDPDQLVESKPGRDARRSGDKSLELASLHAVGRASRRLAALGVDAAGIFSRHGVPLELLVVARAESDFDPAAVSSRGARGLWQLMPTTAREFGLEVGQQSDERIRPQLSTLAAARYLRRLHARFGDWLLALAAYNAGEGRVAAAIEQAQARSFWELVRQGSLPDETRSYVLDVLRLLRR